ncbi:MAG: DNA topoisomerase VI, partial [Planctomycetaceae bacterium]|nr:DNA topoisomerase VI [Planctomycetaceae bacterium]
MAKKKTAKKKTTTKKKATRKKSAAPVSKERDKVTTRSIELLADGIARTGLKGKEPCVDIPLRTVTNMRWNKKKRILEMGDSTQTRNLFNVGQAKKFMQTLLLAKGSRELIKAEKTLSLRGMYYMSLHTIEGTKEKTFNEQSESDNILEDLEVSLGGLREELHVFAKKRGTMVGNITVIDSGDEINCRKMGTGGYAIPSICEPSVMQFKDCGADF